MTLDEAMKRIEELCARDDVDLMRLQGVGPKSVKAIREAAQVLARATGALKRIEELERRVKKLEARPEHVHHHYPPPHPVPLIGHPSWPALLEPWCS
ncbi:MAG: hypothetical protein ACM31O_00080 [Bacteroidota bacterium]